METVTWQAMMTSFKGVMDQVHRESTVMVDCVNFTVSDVQAIGAESLKAGWVMGNSKESGSRMRVEDFWWFLESCYSSEGKGFLVVGSQ